jgi:hypothetical protein
VPKALRARRVNRRLTLPAGAVLLTHAGMWMRFGANSAAFGSRVVVQLPCLRMQEPSPGGCSWRHRCAQPPLRCRAAAVVPTRRLPVPVLRPRLLADVVPLWQRSLSPAGAVAVMRSRGPRHQQPPCHLWRCVLSVRGRGQIMGLIIMRND